MSHINLGKKLASVLGGAAFLTTAGNAAAYSVGSSHFAGENWGNDRFYAQYGYQSAEFSNGYVSSATTLRASQGSQVFYVRAGAFGKSTSVLSWSAAGTGKMSRTGTSAAVYEDVVFIRAIVNNDELFSIPQSDQPCNGSAAASCVSYTKSISKTLFKAEAPFTLAFVPVTVKASLVANLSASADAASRAGKYVNKADSLNGNGGATLSVGSYVEGGFTAVAGVEGILGVGVTAKLRFIDASLSSHSSSKQAAPIGTTATVIHTNVMPLSLKTMGGKVNVWADISPLWHEETTIFSWPGKSYDYQFFGFEGVTEVTEQI